MNEIRILNHEGSSEFCRAASLAMLSTVLYAGNTLSIQGILAVIAVLLYNCGFSIGLGGGGWTYMIFFPFFYS